MQASYFLRRNILTIVIFIISIILIAIICSYYKKICSLYFTVCLRYGFTKYFLSCGYWKKYHKPCLEAQQLVDHPGEVVNKLLLSKRNVDTMRRWSINNPTLLKSS